MTTTPSRAFLHGDAKALAAGAEAIEDMLLQLSVVEPERGPSVAETISGATYEAFGVTELQSRLDAVKAILDRADLEAWNVYDFPYAMRQFREAVQAGTSPASAAGANAPGRAGSWGIRGTSEGVLTLHAGSQVKSTDLSRGRVERLRTCGGCDHKLPWSNWEAALVAHQSSLLVDRLDGYMGGEVAK